MLRAVKQSKHYGRHYNYRVYEGDKNLGLYAANTPTTLVAIAHPSGAEIERPYMLPIDGDVNFVMVANKSGVPFDDVDPAPLPIDDDGYCVPCGGGCREPVRN